MSMPGGGDAVPAGDGWFDTPRRYGRVSRGFHWLMAALIVAALLLIAAGVVSLLGKKQVEQVGPLKPERAMSNVQRDVTQVKEASSREHE